MNTSSNEVEQHTFKATHGILFFGVPSQGMNIEALAATMIKDQPQRYDLVMLDRDLGFRLRAEKHMEFCKAFDYRDSKIISFYETEKTPTFKEVSFRKTLSRRY